jgi:hypothetical protein
MLGPVNPIQTTPLVQVSVGLLDELMLPAEAPLELPADAPLVLSPEAPLVLAADVPLVPPTDVPLWLSPEAPPPSPRAPAERPRPPAVPEWAPVLVPEEGPADVPLSFVAPLPVVSVLPPPFPGTESTPESRPPHPPPIEHTATNATGSRIHRHRRFITALGRSRVMT